MSFKSSQKWLLFSFLGEHNVLITNTPWIQGAFDATLGDKKNAKKIHELIILSHFLKRLEERCETEKLQEPINPAFLHLLSREDLKNILISLYGDEQELEKAHPNYYCNTKEILLFEYIRDEFYILQYFTNVVLKQYLL